MRCLMTIVLLLAPVICNQEEVFAEGEGLHERLIDSKKDTIVSIKAVLKIRISTEGGSQDTDYPVNTTGIVVDATGLVMVPRMLFDLYFYYGEAYDESGVNIQVTDVRVVFPGEPKGVPALMVAKDAGLGLGFVQIQDLGDRKLSVVNLGDTAAPDMEQTLYAITRMTSHFDHAPICVELRAVGRVTKPRVMWLLRGEGVRDMSGCAPLYHADGRVVGVCIHQKGVGEEGSFAPFLLETKRVSRLINKALPRAKEELARAKEAAEEAAAERGEDDKAEDEDEDEEGVEGEEDSDAKDGPDPKKDSKKKIGTKKDSA